jgi:hypothetical protein
MELQIVFGFEMKPSHFFADVAVADASDRKAQLFGTGLEAEAISRHHFLADDNGDSLGAR